MINQSQVNYKQLTSPLAPPLSRGGEDRIWKTFGHFKVKNILQRQLQAKKFPHAYLFFGPEGLGKKTLALEFAQKVLQAERLENHPDFQLLDIEGEIVMSIVLDFIAKLNYKPFLSEKRVVIINNAHNLNLQSSNALLKSLEEPADSIIIILIARERLLPTITSRCQTLNFNPLSQNELKEFAKTLNLKTDQKFFNLCFSSPGRLKTLVSDPKFLQNEQNLIEQFEKLKQGKLAERLLAIAKYAILELFELEQILTTWLNWQLAQLRVNPKDFKLVQVINEAILGLEMNKNKKLILQGLFLKI